MFQTMRADRFNAWIDKSIYPFWTERDVGLNSRGVKEVIRSRAQRHLAYVRAT